MIKINQEMINTLYSENKISPVFLNNFEAVKEDIEQNVFTQEDNEKDMLEEEILNEV